MKRQSILKSALCLLMALVCNVAWADLTGEWTANPVAPWSETSEYPDEVGTNLTTAQGNRTGSVYMAETQVTALTKCEVTIVFNYTGGGHKLNILGVDLVGADDQVKYSDYHYGLAPGDGTTKTYTMQEVEAGDYTLRYYVCNNSAQGDQLNMTNGTISIAGLSIAGTPEEIAIANAAEANANMDIYGLQKYYGLVQDAGTGIAGDGQFICNHPAGTNQESGNAYANLIDGNYETFFHSGYDGTIGTGSHYLQASLSKPVKAFRFYFKKRKQNNNNRPTKITIEGSNDGIEWSQVKVIDNGFPTSEGVLDYYSEAVTSETSYQYLRFTVNNTSGGTVFYTFSEFYILPEYAKVTEAFNAVRNYRAASSVTLEIAEALIEAYEWNTGLSKGTPIVGADHFFFADTKQSDNSYVARYLYNNNGALATSTSLNAKDAKFIWTAAQPEGTQYYTLQNKGDNTKYISYGNNGNGLGVGTTAVQLDIKSSEAVHTGSVGIKRVGTDNDGKYMVTKVDGTAFNRNSSKVNDGSWCSDYVFVPADLYEGLNKFSFVANTSEADAVLTWNGYEVNAGSSVMISSDDIITNGELGVKSCNPAYKVEGFYSDAAYTQKIAEVSALAGDMTVYVKFVLDIFGEQYGDKWVNILRANNANHAIILGSANAETVPIFNTFSYANEGVVWSLVGTAESFKIYNMLSGDALALTPSGTPANGVAVKMVAAANAESWHIISYSDGYAIAPVGNNNWSLNSYGGSDYLGNNIKFYNATDGGSHWNFAAIDATKPLRLDITVDKTWESSPRVAELTFTVNGSTTSTRVLGSVEGQRMYLPVNSTFSVSSMTYRGYTFNGFGNGADSYANQTIPEGGMELTASYTANNERTLYYSPRDGHPYRIPAIATAPNGDIFAICDYRPCGNDIGYGEVDLVCRVSSDNGVTWTEERTIADGHGYGIANGDTTKIWQVGFGDPAIVADRESNEVLVMSVCGNRTCWDGNYGDPNPNPNRVSRLYITYDEEKQEWVYGDPEEVTYSIYPLFDNKNGGEAHVASMFIGAGKICQSRVVKKGDYYRLYCAIWAVTKSIRQHHNYVIYSDDFGQTWNLLGDLGYDNSASKWGNEPKCEELPDGTVVLSSRKYGGRYFNLFEFDDDTYTTGSWLGEVGSNEVQGGLSFGGNSTNGEIYKVSVIRNSDDEKCDLMFQSIPTGGGRTDVAIYYKELDAEVTYTPTTISQGWTKGKHVSTKGSAYSTMILQADGRIAFFFEEEPSGYCMVYIPYTIEELTDGQYSLYVENDDDNTTGADQLTIGNSQLTIYDLAGRRVMNPGKGMYIANGKKVVVK